MKQKTVKNPKQKSAQYLINGQTSKYGRKITQQKRGNFSSNSPFKCSLTESEFFAGIPLKELNQRRFKN